MTIFLCEYHLYHCRFQKEYIRKPVLSTVLAALYNLYHCTTPPHTYLTYASKNSVSSTIRNFSPRIRDLVEIGWYSGTERPKPLRRNGFDAYHFCTTIKDAVVRWYRKKEAT